MFSIIIPVYNAEKTLYRCLESVRKQKYKNFEAILINDGSTDSCKDICLLFCEKDSRFKYIEKRNSGVSAARNSGLEVSQKEFIVFLDSDDEYSSDYLLSFSDAIKENPEFDSYWCGFSCVYQDNKKIERHYFSENEKISVVSRSQIMTLHNLWLDSTLWNKVYRREIIQKNNLRMNIEMSLGEDLLFNYQYLDNCKTNICIVNQTLYLYSLYSNGTLDTKYRSNLNELYDIIDDNLFYYLNKWQVAEDQYKIFYDSVFYMQEKILRNTFRDESKLSFRNKILFNNKILQSKKFRLALKKSQCYIHPLYRLAYRSGKYSMILILDQLLKLKRRNGSES